MSKITFEPISKPQLMCACPLYMFFFLCLGICKDGYAARAALVILEKEKKNEFKSSSSYCQFSVFSLLDRVVIKACVN